MKTILSDIDCVVADLFGPWLSIYNYEYKRDLRVDDLREWDIWKCAPDGKAIQQIIDRPGFFDGLPVLPGAAEGLEELLSQGHEVYLVSAGHGGALGEKSNWVRKHLPFMKNRMFLTDGKTPKGLIRGDVLIDDGPHNLVDFKKRNPGGLAVAAYYRYTEPARSVSDIVVPFNEDTAQSWSIITELLREQR